MKIQNAFLKNMGQSEGDFTQALSKPGKPLFSKSGQNTCECHEIWSLLFLDGCLDHVPFSKYSVIFVTLLPYHLIVPVMGNFLEYHLHRLSTSPLRTGFKKVRF